MASTTHRLSAVDGFSLEVPEALREAGELETRSVCLAAQVEPWSWPEEFRPNLTAEVTALTPDRATVPQLSALTIAAQIARGAHVAACDVWLESDGDVDGRRITSLYAAMDTTVLQRQYVSIRGGRAITVSVHHGAGYERGMDLFRLAVMSIRCEFEDSPPHPDPATMPRLDPFARERGVDVEYLGGVRAAQPFVRAGPPLSEDQLDAVRRGKLRRGTDRAALQEAGLVTDRGKLTQLGESAHRALSATPRREVTIKVRTDGDPRVAALYAYQRADGTALVADAPPGEPGGGTTLEVIASQTIPIALARWLGLAPAWTFQIAEGDARAVRLDTAVLDARLASPDAPPPAHATEGLARMWAQPWQVATLRAGPPGGLAGTMITTTEAGSFAVERDSSSDEAALTPVPSAQYLLQLLRFGGFAKGASA